MLFLNPKGNLALASVSLLERLAFETQMTDEHSVADSVTYKLVANLARSRLPENECKLFQFKVTVALPGTEETAQDLLVSAEHEV